MVKFYQSHPENPENPFHPDSDIFRIFTLVKFYQSHPENPENPENPDSDKLQLKCVTSVIHSKNPSQVKKIGFFEKKAIFSKLCNIIIHF